MSTLILSPAMAQEVEEVHEQALKVLREQLSKPLTNSISSRPSIAESRRIEGEVRRDRQERNMLLREQAEAERARRQELHDQKRQEFEQELREREFLRQQQRDYDESIARQQRALNPGMPVEEVHSQALSVLRGETTPPPTQSSQPTTEVAPAVSEASPSAVTQTSEDAPEDIQQRALQILRQNEAQATPQNVEPAPERTVVPAVIPPRTTEAAPAGQSATSTQPAAAADEDYVKDLERRALQMMGSAPQESAVQVVTPAASAPAEPRLASSPERATAAQGLTCKEVHERALQVLRQQTSQSEPAPVTSQLDPGARDIIERQNAQIAQGMSHRQPSTAPVQETLPSELENQAREVLRQQQAQVSASAPVESTASVGAPAVSSAPAGSEQFSRELEDRARQILAERSGAATQPPPTTQESPAQAPAATVPAAQSATPVPADPSEVHLRALEALRQGTSANGQAAGLTKREKLQALTDLYRADKIGSAEYHQKRAAILAEPGQ